MVGIAIFMNDDILWIQMLHEIMLYILITWSFKKLINASIITRNQYKYAFISIKIFWNELLLWAMFQINLLVYALCFK